MTSLHEFALSSQHKKLIKSTNVLDLYEIYLSSLASSNGVVVYLGDDFGSAQLLTRMLKKCKVIFVTTEESNKRFDKLDNIDVLYGKFDDSNFITYLYVYLRNLRCIALINSLKKYSKVIYDGLYDCLVSDGLFIMEFSDDELAKLMINKSQFVVMYKDALVCKREAKQSELISSGSDEFFGRSPDIKLYDKDSLINELSYRIRQLESARLHHSVNNAASLLAESKEKDRRLKTMANRLLELEKKLSSSSVVDKEKTAIIIADLERKNRELEEKLKSQSAMLDSLMKEAEVSDSDAKETKDEQKQGKKLKKLLNIIKLNKFTSKESKSDVRKALSDGEKEKSSSKLIKIKSLSEDELKQQEMKQSHEESKKQSLVELYKK